MLTLLGSWKSLEYANERIPSLSSLLELVLAETSYEPDIILDLKVISPRSSSYLTCSAERFASPFGKDNRGD